MVHIETEWTKPSIRIESNLDLHSHLANIFGSDAMTYIFKFNAMHHSTKIDAQKHRSR